MTVFDWIVYISYVFVTIIFIGFLGFIAGRAGRPKIETEINDNWVELRVRRLR